MGERLYARDPARETERASGETRDNRSGHKRQQPVGGMWRWPAAFHIRAERTIAQPPGLSITHRSAIEEVAVAGAKLARRAARDHDRSVPHRGHSQRPVLLPDASKRRIESSKPAS